MHTGERHVQERNALGARVLLFMPIFVFFLRMLFFMRKPVDNQAMFYKYISKKKINSYVRK